ncbi:hypothetical protein BT63DRAFT_425022 [Microthyrium microscopicum]|uniref:Uncharacterized protein n=1 Tax=Microthyrium microscopicum TaxID=703497 RepID=A0A6A6UD34_9PEZI|nr:hypothetical protein BT63DRAFT_425022 [Microthyrium microscopicum]
MGNKQRQANQADPDMEVYTPHGMERSSEPKPEAENKNPTKAEANRIDDLNIPHQFDICALAKAT